MARATTSRTTTRSGKGAATRKGAAVKSPRGATKTVKTPAPKRAPKAAAKPVRVSASTAVGRIDQLERNVASLRTRYSELKRALADLTARSEAQPSAAPARPARRRREPEAAPAEAPLETEEKSDQYE